VTLAVFVYSRIDKKKERQSSDYHEYATAQKNVVDALNKMLADKDAEIEKLQQKLNDGENKGILTLPKIQKLNAEIRTMREALSRLNVLVMSQEETNIFAERFATIKEGITHIEEILSE
jgi:peptidoglycan hydrolase CwlO-like protein